MSVEELAGELYSTWRDKMLKAQLASPPEWPWASKLHRSVWLAVARQAHPSYNPLLRVS